MAPDVGLIVGAKDSDMDAALKSRTSQSATRRADPDTRQPHRSTSEAGLPKRADGRDWRTTSWKHQVGKKISQPHARR